MTDEEGHWMSIADLMSALMMVFIVISVGFLHQLKNNGNVYKQKLNAALHDEFNHDLETWKAYITDDNIIRFRAPFDSGSAQLSNTYQVILNEFFPRYIKLLTSKEFKHNIETLRIEGHTSSEWAEGSTDKERYINNMRLSQSRASNVLEFVYKQNQFSIDKNRSWLEERLRANGMAFSTPVYLKNESIKDNVNSRRVEFRVVTKAK